MQSVKRITGNSTFFSVKHPYTNIGFLNDIINNLYSEFSLEIPKILLYNGIKQFFAANLKYGRWIN